MAAGEREYEGVALSKLNACFPIAEPIESKQPHSFFYPLPTADLVIATRRIWLQSLEHLLSGPLHKKSTDLCLREIPVFLDCKFIQADKCKQ